MRALPLAAALAILAAFGTAGAGSRHGTTAEFNEEFAAPALDRTRWNVIVTGRTVNDEQQAYVDSPDVLYISDGMLVIQPRFRAGFKTPEGRSFDFISGRIDTRDKFSFTYGTASARMKLAAGAGLWPAFWALGAGRWPDTGEIDIMEYVGEKDWTGVAVHGPGYSGETPLVNKFFFEDGTDVTSWHEYAVEWTDQAMVFKVDDREIYRATRPMVEHYGEWVFDTPKYLIVNFALGGAYPFKTNGIERPYNGLPAETVERIKAGEIMMEVDWVRVHRR